jgi:hypothetical protein
LPFVHAGQPGLAERGRWTDPWIAGNIGVPEGPHVRPILIDPCMYLISSADGTVTGDDINLTRHAFEPPKRREVVLERVRLSSSRASESRRQRGRATARDPQCGCLPNPASSNTFTTGSALAQAACTRTPFRGCPHRGTALQPLTVVVIVRSRHSRRGSLSGTPAWPDDDPCTTPECVTHARAVPMTAHYPRRSAGNTIEGPPEGHRYRASVPQFHCRKAVRSATRDECRSRPSYGHDSVHRSLFHMSRPTTDETGHAAGSVGVRAGVVP